MTSNALTPTGHLDSQPSATYVEKIGNTWGISLIWATLIGAVFTPMVLELYWLSTVALACTIAFSFFISRRRKQAVSTLPATYEVAVTFICMVALLAVLMPAYDDPSSTTWRVPLMVLTVLVYHRYVCPGYHLAGEEK